MTTTCTARNVPIDAARRLADRLPTCRFVEWDGAHAVTPDRIDTFLRDLRAMG